MTDDETRDPAPGEPTPAELEWELTHPRKPAEPESVTIHAQSATGGAGAVVPSD